MRPERIGFAATIELTLCKYDVLESGDPACSHARGWTDAADVQRCGCGRTVVLASKRTVTEGGD